MVKLKHIVGSNLLQLEAVLEKVKQSIVIVGVNNVGGNWFIHFLVQDTLGANMAVSQELGIEEIALANTKNRRIKK